VPREGLPARRVDWDQLQNRKDYRSRSPGAVTVCRTVMRLRKHCGAARSKRESVLVLEAVLEVPPRDFAGDLSHRVAAHTGVWVCFAR
jgi:hypothetical protein